MQCTAWDDGAYEGSRFFMRKFAGESTVFASICRAFRHAWGALPGVLHGHGVSTRGDRVSRSTSALVCSPSFIYLHPEASYCLEMGRCGLARLVTTIYQNWLPQLYI